ncbi:MAG: DUF4429 domain-containing protein [Nocardioidaceae bacterium]
MTEQDERSRPDQTLCAKGRGGTVTFDTRFVTIIRRGVLARMSYGKGEKRIPVARINAVQWKPAGVVVNGFIQFTIAGGNEVRSAFGRQTIDASRDENSVIFTRKQQPAFAALRDAIDETLA